MVWVKDRASSHGWSVTSIWFQCFRRARSCFGFCLNYGQFWVWSFSILVLLKSSAQSSTPFAFLAGNVMFLAGAAGRRGVFRSPVFYHPRTVTCPFTINFYMSGADSRSLEVRFWSDTRNETLFARYGNQGAVWRRATIALGPVTSTTFRVSCVWNTWRELRAPVPHHVFVTVTCSQRTCCNLCCYGDCCNKNHTHPEVFCVACPWRVRRNKVFLFDWSDWRLWTDGSVEMFSTL